MTKEFWMCFVNDVQLVKSNINFSDMLDIANAKSP